MEKLAIPFTEQQLVLLSLMQKERGDERPLDAVVLEMFRDYARQTLGREYRQP